MRLYPQRRAQRLPDSSGGHPPSERWRAWFLVAAFLVANVTAVILPIAPRSEGVGAGVISFFCRLPG